MFAFLTSLDVTHVTAISIPMGYAETANEDSQTIPCAVIGRSYSGSAIKPFRRLT